MRFRFCPECGAPVARPAPDAGGDGRVAVRCPECRVSVHPTPQVRAGAVLTRQGEAGPEVLLVRRTLEDASGGAFALPSRALRWGEDAREAATRACHDQTGVSVEVTGVYDVHSDVEDPERPEVSTYFRVRSRGDAPAAPTAGAEAVEAAFLPLGGLPELASPADALILERLHHELGTTAGADGARALEADLAARLDRRRQRYRNLLQAYTDELMRGAWVNELHLRLSRTDAPAEISSVAAKHIASRREVDEVRVWFPGPPDRCDGCPWRDRCPQVQCLHLVTHVRGATPESDALPLMIEEPDEEDDGALAREEQRVPLLRGLPAADVSLSAGPIQAELPGRGAKPTHFDGFPLEVGGRVPGVLGLISRVPIDANQRRLLEVVARHVGTLVRNARLVEDLRAANNVKRSFIARLSHELKTPLTAILSFAELLREELEGEGNALGADGASTIETEGRKLLDTLETILEIAKLESGTVAFRPQRVDLRALVEERLPAFRDNAKPGLTVGFAPSPLGFVGSATVWADPHRVRQTLDQLLANAVKFTREGAVEVSLQPGEDEVVCQISDTGIGVPREHRAQIFEAFYQGSEGIHLEYGGLGLGLAMAKVLVEKQGGRIWVDSTTGQGSSFYFSLPRSARVVEGGA